MKRTKYIVIALLFLKELDGFSQNLSNKGTEFWVGYGHHQFMEPGQNNSQEMVLYFSADPGVPANVTVSIRGRTATQTTNYFVPGGTVIASNYMPKSGALDCRLYDVPPTFGGNGGEGLFNLSIHIESDVPIVAYAHIFGSLSSGATMLMPVETWGYSYYSLNSQQNYGNNNCFSWMFVVAQEDNTVIQVVPSVPTRTGHAPGVPFNVNLNQGEIYQLIGASITSSSGHDLSGTKVTSVANSSGDCYPVAVFSGSSRTAITCPTGGSGSGDNIIQQIFPFQAWGKRYLTAPFSHQNSASQMNGGVVRVAVKDPTTVVKRNGVVLTGLISNFYYQFQSNTADYIEADKPILVAQYMPSTGSCGYSGFGDPEMIYVSPIEQGIKRIGFYRNNREGISTNYLTLIIPTNGVSSLRIDGSSSFNHSYPHPQLAGYTVVVKRWSSAQSQAIAYSDSAFTAITYGLGSVESYGYNAGTLINNLNAVSSIQNILDPSVAEHLYTCEGSPIKLSVLMAYQPTRLDWLLSNLGGAITPNTDVIDMSPVTTGTVVVNGITYYKYTLPGTYQFNWADTFFIKLRGYHPSIENCYTREDLFIEVVVKEKPVSDFTFSHTGCTLDTVYFSSADSSSNGYDIRDYNWTFPGPVMATGQYVNKLLPPGVHNISLNVISIEGCTADTTKSITIYDKPPAEFQVIPATLCEGNAFTITDTSSAAIAVNEWYWDFGNGITQTVTTGPSVTYTYPAYGTYTIRHVAKSSMTCVSDTVSRIVTVYAKPSVSFINSASGCLDPSGQVLFNGTAVAADGQSIATYAWNFGDPNATPGNPNTSAIQTPTHNYQQGTYSVNFSATTANGCSKDTTETLTFNLKPLLSYPALNAVCESDAVLSVAAATVTNGVTGTGMYSGPGTDVSGNFDPAVAGYGTHTIKYVFTSGAGCADSIIQTILVHAKPRSGFTFTSGCLAPNGLVQFTDNTTIPDGQSFTWLWNFNDPNATGGNPNTSTAQNPTHLYGEGTYNVNLAVTTANGCVKDTTINAVFAVTPALQYSPLTAVCQNPGMPPLSVATAAVTNGVTGTGVYSGPGITPIGMFDPNAAGQGIHTITYSFTSAGGCTETITSTIEVYPRPTASFNINATDVCLGQGILLTDASTISSGTVNTWNWDFGDGNTASNNNGNPFSVTYTTANSYIVQLVAVSDRGCLSLPYTQTVNIRPLPVADFVLPSGICMPGGNAMFNNQSSVADNSSLTYNWDFGDGNSTNATNPSHVYPAIGSYNVTLTATSPYGCIGQVNKTLSDLYDKPVANFSVNPQELCQGIDNVFTDGSTAPNSSVQQWNWNFDDGSTANIANPVKRFNNPGVYDVTLTVTNAVGCVSDVFTLLVTVHQQPVIDAGRDYILPQGTAVQLTATSNSPAFTFSWSPSMGLSKADTLNPVLTALQDQTYTLTATGSFGCTASDFFTVKILKPVKVPNVFSPNGDNIHDKWMIPNLADYPGCTVEIFNRYGQQVFYSISYGIPWDGKMKGKDLPVGTYYYVIQLQNGFKPMTGSVTIIR